MKLKNSLAVALGLVGALSFTTTADAAFNNDNIRLSVSAGFAAKNIDQVADYNLRSAFGIWSLKGDLSYLFLQNPNYTFTVGSESSFGYGTGDYSTNAYALTDQRLAEITTGINVGVQFYPSTYYSPYLKAGINYIHLHLNDDNTDLNGAYASFKGGVRTPSGFFVEGEFDFGQAKYVEIKYDRVNYTAYGVYAGYSF